MHKREEGEREREERERERALRNGREEEIEGEERERGEEYHRWTQGKGEFLTNQRLRIPFFEKKSLEKTDKRYFGRVSL